MMIYFRVKSLELDFFRKINKSLQVDSASQDQIVDHSSLPFGSYK